MAVTGQAKTKEIAFKDCLSTQAAKSMWEEWSFLINFGNNSVTHTMISSDKSISDAKKLGLPTQKYKISTYPITTTTPAFVVVKIKDFMNTEYVFNLKNGEMEVTYQLTGLPRKNTVYKCSIN